MRLGRRWQKRLVNTKSGSPRWELPLVFGRSVRACKPNPVCRAGAVSPGTEGHHLSGTVVADRLKRPTCTVHSAGHLRPESIREAVLLGLSPRGVCRATPVARSAGVLLPHPSTPYRGRQGRTPAGLLSIARAVMPAVRHAFRLGSTVPYGVRTFLTAALISAGGVPSPESWDDGAMTRPAHHLLTRVGRAKSSPSRPGLGPMQKSAAT